ncbi:unnamed protein product [Porites evermanni]|uniref:Nucleolus and neural progenitor protein-like N-terminal domain-containing protein n=1 Tax=Porites evermanni TaxID=104178 RepID=A0ABN8SJ46_9CNID|nr:unnamed protein product [Porites evermanni]
MAAITAFWNRRGVVGSHPTDPQLNSSRESADTEIIINTISRLGIVHRELKLPQLWSEAAIIKALIYKHGNTHKKQKYFQGLKRVIKCLNRLEEMAIYDKVADLKNTFPRLSKRRTLAPETISNSPTFGMIISTLGCLIGSAQLLLQMFMFTVGFWTFRDIPLDVLFKFKVLVRSFLLVISECYEIIFPWLNVVADPEQVAKSEAKDLPKSIETWLETRNSHRTKDTSKFRTPCQNILTPGTLDKLFASTPRHNPKGSFPREFNAETPPGMSYDLGNKSFILDEISSSMQGREFAAETGSGMAYNLGESFIPGEISRSLQDFDAQVGEQNITFKRKLVAENTEIATKLHALAGDQNVNLERKLFAENTKIATKLHELAGDQNVNLERKLVVAENIEIATNVHELAGDQNVTLEQKLVAEDTEIATNVHELAEEQDVALKRKLDAEITQIATKLHKSAENQTVILKRKLVAENTNIASKTIGINIKIDMAY